MVTELQGNGLSGLDLCSLGCVIQNETIFCTGFFDYQCGARINVFNQNGACGVGGKVAVAIDYHSAVALGHKELHVGQGFAGESVNLFDQQAAFGRIPKIQLHHILVIAADVGGLGCCVDYMAAVTGQFLDYVSAGLQSCDCERAIHTGLIGSNNCPTGTGGATQVFNLKYGTFNRFASHRIIFVDNQCGERGILKG